MKNRICVRSHLGDAWEDISHLVSDCNPSAPPEYDWPANAGLVYADDREEDGYCERSTQGCSVNHTKSQSNVSCEGW